MSSTSTGLSSRTLKTISKLLPENNEEKPRGFPIGYSEFCKFTNVRELTIEAIKQTRPKSYKMYLRNEDCIRAQEYNLYLTFYKSSKRRTQMPLNELKIKDCCPEELRDLVLSFQKNVEDTKRFPVSFEMFCKYTNCASIVDEHLKKRGHSFDKSSPEWQKCARKLYLTFYISKEQRKKLKVEIKPCAKTFKEQLLKFAEDVTQEAVRDNHVSDSSKHLKNLQSTYEPLPKRPRICREADPSDCVEFNEENFPVSYDTFLMHTDIKVLAERYLKNSFKVTPDSVDIINFTRKLYIDYYTKPRHENNLLNEILVRGKYADQITSLTSYQLSTNTTSQPFIVESRAKNNANAVVIQSVHILPPVRLETIQTAKTTYQMYQPQTNEIADRGSVQPNRCSIQKDPKATHLSIQTNLPEAIEKEVTGIMKSSQYSIQKETTQVGQLPTEINQPQTIQVTDRMSNQSNFQDIQQEKVQAEQMYSQTSRHNAVEIFNKRSTHSDRRDMHKATAQESEVSTQTNEPHTGKVVDRGSIQLNQRGIQEETAQAPRLSTRIGSIGSIQSSRRDIQQEAVQAGQMPFKTNQPEIVKITDRGSIILSNCYKQKENAQTDYVSTQTNQLQTVDIANNGSIQQESPGQMCTPTDQSQTVEIGDRESIQLNRRNIQQKSAQFGEMCTPTDQSQTFEIGDRGSIQLNQSDVQQETTQAAQICTQTNQPQTVEIDVRGSIQLNQPDVQQESAQTGQMCTPTDQSQPVEIVDRGSIQLNQSDIPQETAPAEQMCTQSNLFHTNQIVYTGPIQSKLSGVQQETVQAQQIDVDELKESAKNVDSWQYPVSFERFCKNALLENVIENILKERSSLQSNTCNATALGIAREIYENFYKYPEKRKKYALRFKPLPKHLKRNLLEFAFKKEDKAIKLEENEFGEIDVQLTKPVAAFIKERKKLQSLCNKNSTVNVLVGKDPIEHALKEIFGDSDSDSNTTVIDVKIPRHGNKSMTPQERLSRQESVKLSSESSKQGKRSSGESIKIHQNLPTKSMLHKSSPHKDLMQGFSQIQSHSMLEPLNHNTCVASQESVDPDDHFIDMPNTQLQYKALATNENSTTFESDPLNGSLVGLTLNEIKCNEHRISSTGIPLGEYPTHTSENAEFVTKIKEENSSEGIVSLRNLQFNLDESGNNFDVCVFSEDPILLNDTSDHQIFDCISKSFSQELRSLVNQLNNSHQEINKLITLEGSEETFVCAEAQHFPSSLCESSQQKQNTETLPTPIEEDKSPNENPVCDVNATKNPENFIKSQSMSKPCHKRKIKHAHYRVVKSKNLAYDVPQVFHNYRALTNQEGSTKNK